MIREPYFITTLLGIPVFSFITGGVGAFIGSYLKKKGENLAIHEDIKKLVDQVKATTEATTAETNEGALEISRFSCILS